MTFYCDDFPVECCDSCHQDEEEGYDSIYQEDWLHACCAVTVFLADHFDQRYTWTKKEVADLLASNAKDRTTPPEVTT
jgi:uncharacterized protein CbrC (UPF0167 family)